MSTRCLILTAAGAAMATVWVAILSGLLVAHLAGEASSRAVLHVSLLALSVASVLVGVALIAGAAVRRIRSAMAAERYAEGYVDGARASDGRARSPLQPVR